MKGIILAVSALCSVVLLLASPFPRETPFFIVLLSFTLIPFRSCIALALVTGFCVDLFSSVPGLSVVTYPLGLLLASFLASQLLSYRSFFGFCAITLTAGAFVSVVKIVFFMTVAVVAGSELRTLVELIMGSGYIFVLACAWSFLYVAALYGVLVAVSPRWTADSNSRMFV